VLRWFDSDTDGTIDDDEDAEIDGEQYYTHDANFNVTALLDDTGAALERYHYDPYGAVTRYAGDWGTHQTDYENPYLYTGRRLDAETGLYYYFARYYHAQLGRFINRDPIGYGGGDANLYRYVGNAPTNASDPSGLEIQNRQMHKQYHAMFPDDPLLKAFIMAGGRAVMGNVYGDHKHEWIEDDPDYGSYYLITIEKDLYDDNVIEAALLLRL